MVETPLQCTTWPDDIVDIKYGTDFTLVLTHNQEGFSCGYSVGIGRVSLNAGTENPILDKIDDLSEIVN